MTTIDQGFLTMLNSALPNCSSNNELATFAIPYVKSVAKGAPCDVGYTKDNPLTKDGLLTSKVYDLCASTAMVPPSTDLQNRMKECVMKQYPSPVPAPGPPKDTGLPMWAIALIIAIVALVIVVSVSYIM